MKKKNNPNNEQNMRILATLALSNTFRQAMDKNIDAALKNEGLTPDPEFRKRLEEYKTKRKFVEIESSSILDTHDALHSNPGLESRW